MPGVITIYPKRPLPHRLGGTRFGVFCTDLVLLLGLVCSCQGTQLVAVGDKLPSGGTVAAGGSTAVGGSSALGGSLALGGSTAIGGSSTTVSDPGMGGASAGSSSLGAGGSVPLPPTRAKIGEACVGDAECMSGICRGNRCAVPTCGARGESCTVDKDCCGGMCENSICLNYDGSGVIGETCKANSECASKACFDAGTGIGPRCQALDGCRTDGELCNNASDCCSKRCLGAAVTGSTKLVYRCQFNPDSVSLDGCFQQSGLFCDNQQAHCCGGGRGGLPTGTSTAPNCVPNPAGSARCHTTSEGPQPKDYSCESGGNGCRFTGDCCIEREYLLCRPSVSATTTDTQLTCQAGCANTYGLCRADRDCCPGLACVFNREERSVDGTCQDLGLSCRLLGQPCTSPGSCCAGICSDKFSGLPTPPGAPSSICTIETFDRGSM